MASLIKRKNVYYAQYRKGGKTKRLSLETESLQIAKEKLRQLESSLYRGDAVPFPTKTPIPDALSAYIKYMQTVKTERSVVRDLYYLREAFGPVCPALQIKNQKISAKAKKCKVRGDIDRIEANYFEQITTADISAFIATQVRRKGLRAKTANRFREILTRLFNWSMQQNGLILPGDRNPAAKVERYRERAPEISFLKLDEIDKQLKALEHLPDLQVMVAVYIYAGLRREELCWLTVDDVDFAAGGNGMIRVRAKTVNKEFWEPKTKVNRVVPVSTNLRKYLEKYPCKVVEGGWYFSTQSGKRWDPDNLSRYLRNENGKVGESWACLDFRHTFGSQLAMKGESLYKISKLMGNSPDFCRKHYAALIPEPLIGIVYF